MIRRDALHVGQVLPREGLEVSFVTPDGTHELFKNIQTDPENLLDPNDPNGPVMLATRQSMDFERGGDAEVQEGRIRGIFREAGHFVWEHKIAETTVATIGLCVALNTLKVRYRR